MPDSIQCAIHGESRKTFVCTHLLGETTGLGFNRDDPTDDNPFPTRGVTIVSSYAPATTAGTMNRKSWQRSLCSARGVTNARSFATRGPQSPLVIWLSSGGSVAVARSGIPGPASISVTIHLTTGLRSMKRPDARPASCRVGARTGARPS